MQRARINHRGDDAVNLETRVDAIAHRLDGFDEQRDATQRKELRLHRDDHAMSRGQGVDREQTEGRLTVDQNHIVIGFDVPQNAGQRALAGNLIDELHFSRGQVNVCWNDVEVFRRCVADRRLDVRLRVHEQRVNRLLHVERINAQADGGGTLGIEIHDQDPSTVLGQRGAQVDSRRRLADATLLIAHRDHASGTVPRQRRGHREIDRLFAQVGRQRRMRVRGHAPILIHDRTDASVRS